MIFTIGVILFLVGLFLVKMGDPPLERIFSPTKLEELIGNIGLIISIVGICAIITSIGMLTWKYLP